MRRALTSIDVVSTRPTVAAVHELSIVESLVCAVEERVQPARVTSVCLRIGQLSGVATHALRFCFDVCTRDTLLEGARLDIDEVAGRVRCRACGVETSVSSFLEFCPCGSAELEVLAGQDLRLSHVEVS